MSGRRKAFRPYLRCLADQMGLRDWTVGIRKGEPPLAERAQVEIIYGRKILWVWLSKSFLKDSPESQRQTVCHELVHGLFAPMHQFLYEELGERPFATYKMLLEYGVDAMADAVAPFMPLPSEVEAVPGPLNPKGLRMASKKNCGGMSRKSGMTKTPAKPAASKPAKPKGKKS